MVAWLVRYTLVYTRFIPVSFRGFDRHVVDNRRKITTMTGKAEYIAGLWDQAPATLSLPFLKCNIRL